MPLLKEKRDSRPSEIVKQIRDVFLPSILSRLGVCHLLRKILWRNQTAILFYHDPKPDKLDAHLSYLTTVAKVVSISELRAPSDGPRAIITIDDGMVSNAKLKDVFQRHGVRPLLYICTGIAAKNAGYWWLGLERSLVERLKLVPNNERKTILLEHGFDEGGEACPRQAMSLLELKEAMDWADLGGHTRFHPILPHCEDDEARQEIIGSKDELEAVLGVPFEHFAYPNGSYSDRDVALVQLAGFKTARTCDPGWNAPATDPFRLKGIYIDDAASVDKFALQLTGVPAFIAVFSRRLRLLLREWRARGRTVGHLGRGVEQLSSGLHRGYEK